MVFGNMQDAVFLSESLRESAKYSILHMRTNPYVFVGIQHFQQQTIRECIKQLKEGKRVNKCMLFGTSNHTFGVFFENFEGWLCEIFIQQHISLELFVQQEQDAKFEFLKNLPAFLHIFYFK
ncbi:MAG: hypothetical protein MR629_07075 [Helicobacter sp.]|nr:hypothetical protein [Helicobacter sp.]MCI7484968.1 hypothetical protein [Helicobacter sp.]MDD7568201.1 hypothetical protein [Helicobacter sp.]